MPMLFYFPMIIWAGLIELAQEQMRAVEAVVPTEPAKRQ